MPPHQPGARSLDDILPHYIPRYTYRAKQQFREIIQIESTRHKDLNQVFSQRNKGNWNANLDLSQLKGNQYQDSLEKLNNRYEGSMPRRKCCKIDQSSTSLSQSVKSLGSSPLCQADLKSFTPRKSNLHKFFSNPTTYTLFEIPYSRFKTDFLEADRLGRFCSFRQNNLLVMAPPAPEHGVAAGEMTKRILSWIERMSLISEIVLYQTSDVPAIDDPKEVRIPDSAFGPKVAPAGFDTRRPTCAIEIGHTQSLPDLIEKAKWWLDPQKGAASVCINCKLDRTPRLVIDVWERVLEGQEGQTRRASHIILSKRKGSDQVMVRGSPLVLKFHLMFRRLPVIIEPQTAKQTEDEDTEAEGSTTKTSGRKKRAREDEDIEAEGSATKTSGKKKRAREDEDIKAEGSATKTSGKKKRPREDEDIEAEGSATKTSGKKKRAREESEDEQTEYDLVIEDDELRAIASEIWRHQDLN